ncbi:MAG: 2-amino-4-hydroxy-6-hydroxymethyldihydropteridine diphosphokinase, partial [Rikenellaceae bacterium]
MESSNIVVLSLGANIGDKVNNFKKVIEYISSYIGSIINKSAIYESKAWGFESDDNFLNQVLVVETSLKSDELLTTIWRIERLFGRERGDRKNEVDKYKIRKNSKKPIYLSRSMDIDILF